MPLHIDYYLKSENQLILVVSIFFTTSKRKRVNQVQQCSKNHTHTHTHMPKTRFKSDLLEAPSLRSDAVGIQTLSNWPLRWNFWHHTHCPSLASFSGHLHVRVNIEEQSVSLLDLSWELVGKATAIPAALRMSADDQENAQVLILQLK